MVPPCPSLHAMKALETAGATTVPLAIRKRDSRLRPASVVMKDILAGRNASIQADDTLWVV